jgi:adenosylcobinamide-GDP ribazoletransferase
MDAAARTAASSSPPRPTLLATVRPSPSARAAGTRVDQALTIMRKSDVGPFGVATLVLALLLQVASLSTAFARGSGPAALVVALVVSRLALPLACSTGVPAARADGLGRTVAGTVGRGGLLLAAVLAPASIAVFLGFDALLGDAGPRPGARWLLLSGVAPLLAGWLLTRRCVHRLGGVTGDVLGACTEVTFAVSLLLGTFG